VAATLHYFMLPDDERSLFRHLARRELTFYPDLIPPGHVPVRVDEHAVEAIPHEAGYLAAERLGAVIVHPVKRGPDKGMLVVEEIPSPVFHYERSIRNDAGELVAGRLWAELFRKNWRRSDPKGFWVGPHAAAAWKRRELVLREGGHKGRGIGVWR
jgi:hypothetical protein